MTDAEVRPALRRAAARAGIAGHAARDGPGRVGPGGDRRSRCCACARHAARADGIEEPRAWPAASRSTASATARSCATGRSRTSGFSRRPAMRAGRWARRCSSGISCSTHRAAARHGDSAAGLAARARISATTRSAAFLDSTGPTYRDFDRRDELLRRGRRADRRRRRSSAGCRAAWSSARARSGAAASSAMPAAREMQSVMNLKIKFREIVPAVRAVGACRSTSTSTSRCDRRATARTCCWWRRCEDEQRARCTTEQMQRLCGHREAERAALDDAGHHARRLLGARPDRDAAANGRYYRLIKAFKEQTGCPVMINTSFNVRGEPIVCTPEDAYRCFMGRTWMRWCWRTRCCSKRSRVAPCRSTPISTSNRFISTSPMAARLVLIALYPLLLVARIASVFSGHDPRG